MKDFLVALDRRIRERGPYVAWVLAALGVGIVGGVDYLTGYEVSMSLFYLVPVGIAAWYGGTSAGAVIAMISCVSWYVADLATGHLYSHPAIAVWNAAVRLGFFIVTAISLAAIRQLLLELWNLSRTDSLTGLFGRRAFDDRLQHDLELAQRRESAITLAYMDVDNFKTINDVHGHARGDKVLQTAGRAIRASIRRTDTAARLGGDEFALILPDTDERGARHLIEALSRKIQDALADGDLKITCSMGAVTFADAAVSPAAALAAADALMYETKRKGKGAVGFSVVGEPARPHESPV